MLGRTYAVQIKKTITLAMETLGNVIAKRYFVWEILKFRPTTFEYLGTYIG